MTMSLEEITKQLESANAQIAELQKSQQMMTSTDSVDSMQIAYTPGLQTKVFEKAPYYRYLESKGRVMEANTTNVAFFKETDNSFVEWIAEDADIPDAIASKYDDESKRMKTLVYPIDIGLMAQMGNDKVDLMARELEKGFIKIANTMDSTLLEGTGADNDFEGLTTQIPNANKVNLSTSDDGVLTEEVIEDMLVQLIDNNGANVDCIVTSYGVGKILKRMVAPYRRYNDKVDIQLGHRVIGYESITGADIPILIDSNLSTTAGTGQNVKDDHKLLFVDSSSVEVKRLLAPTVFQNLPTNKLGSRNAIVSFVTSQNIANFRNGMISGIDISASLEALAGGDDSNNGS